MLCLALPCLDLHAADSGDPAVTGERDRIVRLVHDLRGGKDVECERTVRVLLGIEGTDPIDYENIAGLLGIEGGKGLDCEEVLRLVLGARDADPVLDNERIVKLLLGIGGEDRIDGEQIDRLLRSLGQDDPPE
jgi:hypothetical protein